MKDNQEPHAMDSSPILSDVKDTEDADTDDTRGRSRARRRTAREIATMFEQLKTRHVTRKREWLEEKEELLTKLKTAEDSKRVLDGLKIVLLNLRTELKEEENRRISLETTYAIESEEWKQEREQLIKYKKECQDAKQRLSNNSDMVNLRNKIQQQDSEIAGWRKKMINMQTQLLTQEKKYKETFKIQEHDLEKERQQWKNSKRQMEEQILSLQESAESSDLVNSPNNLEATTQDSSILQNKDKISSTKNKYNEFHKTVNDALKEIEKVSDDLRNIDKSSPTVNDLANFYNTKLSETDGTLSSLSFSSAKDDTSTIGTGSSTLHVESTNNDSSLSNSSSNTVKTNLRIVKPLPKPPLRRVSQVDIVLSSPEVKELATNTLPPLDIPTVPSAPNTSVSPFIPIVESDIVVTSPENKVFNKSPLVNRDRSSTDLSFHTSTPMRSLSHTSSDGTGASFTRGGRRSSSENNTNSKMRYLQKSDSLNDSMGSLNSNPSRTSYNPPLYFDTTCHRSVSPKLPKLHQQLLFKGRHVPKEPLSLNRYTPTLVNTKQSSFGESSSAAETNIVLIKKPISPRIETPKTNDSNLKSYTPYFDPKVGYVPKNRKENLNIPQPWSDRASDQRLTPTSNDEQTKRWSGNFVSDYSAKTPETPKQPPVVQPKPKIQLKKDSLGNILSVSKNEAQKQTFTRNINNHNSAKDFVKSPEPSRKTIPTIGGKGRSWIKKRLNIKDTKRETEPQQHLELPKEESHPDRGRSSSSVKQDATKPGKGRMFKRRSRSSHAHSSTDESDDGVTQRESFLSWKNRKKNKNKQGGEKKKGRAYTRSNTEGVGGGFEMRNFLSRFKTSQNNPKKPSVVKQFELKLLENEVKQMESEQKPEKRKAVNKNRWIEKVLSTHSSELDSIEKGYSGEDEWERNPDGTIRRRKKILSPTKRSPVRNTATRTQNVQEGLSYIKPNPKAYRRSMSDLHTVIDPFSIKNKSPNTKKRPAQNFISQKSTSIQPKSKVTNLLTKFGNVPEENNKTYHSNFVRYSPGRSSLHESSSPAIALPAYRERSTTMQGAAGAKPVLARYNSQLTINEAQKKLRNDQKTSTNTNQLKTKPNETKVDFKNKVNIVEQALKKKPSKMSRRYRRADTQPIRSPGFDSSESETDSEGYKPFNDVPPSSDSLDLPHQPTVGSSSNQRFNKPSAPSSRRLPSRWAR